MSDFVLTCESAAFDVYEHIELIGGACNLKRLGHDVTGYIEGEVFLHASSVDYDFALSAGNEANASNRALSSACAEILYFLGFLRRHKVTS